MHDMTHFKTRVIITLAEQSLQIGALQALVADLQIKATPGLSWDEAFEKQKQQVRQMWDSNYKGIVTEMALSFGIHVDLETPLEAVPGGAQASIVVGAVAALGGDPAPGGAHV